MIVLGTIIMELQDLVREAGSRYWARAVGPLHNLTWETLTLFLFLGLLIALIATVLLRYSWAWSKPTIKEARIRSAGHLYQGNLRLSPEDYLAFHRLSPTLSFESDQVKTLVRKDAPRYYIVTIVEAARRRALLYTEMCLQVATRRGRAAKNTIQLDQQMLTEVRLNNGYEEDDEPGTELIGAYNVYIRRVRWYDVRHWLLHPNREIRIVVWVTLITTTLPVLLDVLFG